MDVNKKNELLKLNEELIVQSRSLTNEDGEESFNNGLNFTEIVLEEMKENSLIDEYAIVYMAPNKQEEIYAYGFSNEGSILDIYITFFNKNIEILQDIDAKHIYSLISKPYSFLKELIGGTYDGKWGDDTLSSEFINLMHENLNAEKNEKHEGELIESVCIHLITNTQAEAEAEKCDKHKNSIELPEGLRMDRLPVAIDIIDIRKISEIRQIEDGNNKSVVIDLARYQGGCQIVQTRTDDDIGVILTVLPGQLLYDIYEQYGRLILQDNVRAYLGAKGKINKTMRNTIMLDPESFLIFNNGLTIFSDGVVIKDGKLIRLDGCSIVNGGQTLRTVHEVIDHFIEKDKKESLAKVKKLYVMAKIVSAPSNKREEIRADVSLYSNSQNKVTDVDKTAFDMFTKKIEELAYNTKTMEGQYWFFERLRGEYNSRVNSEKHKFTNKFPKSKFMTKEQLAKYWNAFEGYPTIANLGGQKSHAQFINKLRTLKSMELTVDTTFFKRVVVRAIFYRTCEKVASEMKILGYRSQIVNFTVASLVRAIKKTSKGLNEESIWDMQALDDDWDDLIKDWIEKVQASFINSVDPKLNAAMEARKEKCWEKIKSDMDKFPIVITPKIDNDLSSPWADYDYEDKIQEIMKLSEEDWGDLISWVGKEENCVETKSQQILLSLMSYHKGGWTKEPSERQTYCVWEPFTRWLNSRSES